MEKVKHNLKQPDKLKRLMKTSWCTHTN